MTFDGDTFIETTNGTRQIILGNVGSAEFHAWISKACLFLQDWNIICFNPGSNDQKIFILSLNLENILKT